MNKMISGKIIVCFFMIQNIYCKKSSCLINNPQICEKSLTTVSGSQAPSQVCAGKLIFEDSFNSFDLQKWRHENTLSGGGNWEFQWYTNNRSNTFVKDGVLFIKPTLTSDAIGEENLSKMNLDINGDSTAYCTDPRFWGCLRQGTRQNILNPIRSGKLTTINSFAFKYGTLRVKAKIPSGDWLWPAIWLKPRYNAYGTWPSSGEIDLLESRGNEKLLDETGKNIGSEQISSTLEWGPNPNYNSYQKTSFSKNSPGLGYNNDFRVYELLWTPDYLKFSIDGSEIGTIQPNETFWKLGEYPENMDNPWNSGTKMAPFDDEFYLILNLAVGGTNGYFPDTSSNPVPKPWSNKSPTALTDFWKNKEQWLPTWKLETNNAALKIDYVKIWAL